MRIETMAVFSCCKTFSGKYIFSGNANFRKRKVFPCVWLHFKKFSGKYFLVFGKEEGKHKLENTSHNPEKKKSSTMKMFLVRRPCRDRDRRRDRDLTFFARSRSTARSCEASIAILDLPLSPSIAIFFWVVACVFLDLCYPSSFPNTRKYFPENFLKCNQTHGNIFLFRKLAFLENMYFSENVL